MQEVGRKQLPHEIPLFIDPSREIYYITICCQPRGMNQLCRAEVAERLFETVQLRNTHSIWYCRLFMIMPDHVHFLASFPPQSSIQSVISSWKRWTARQLKIYWQRDFFEHRIRNEENWKTKAEYILQNPVRADLVGDVAAWKYVWFPKVPEENFKR